MRRRSPFWDLTTVQGLAAAGQLRLSRTRALDSFETDSEGMAAAVAAIAALQIGQFSETVRVQDTEECCDVYGVRRGVRGWYLKLTIDDGLLVLSFHPLAFPIATNAGTITP